MLTATVTIALAVQPKASHTGLLVSEDTILLLKGLQLLCVGRFA